MFVSIYSDITTLGNAWGAGLMEGESKTELPMPFIFTIILYLI